MTAKQGLISDVAALLTSLPRESGALPVARSLFYLACGCDLERERLVSDVCRACNWVEITSDSIVLTEAGRAKADEIDAALGQPV